YEPHSYHPPVDVSLNHSYHPQSRRWLTLILPKAQDPFFFYILVIEQQRMIIPNKHGEKLVGLLHETESKEIVILCHGFKSTKDYNTLTNLAAALEKEGISVFRFDFAGNGESEGSFQYGNYYREADDLHAVIQHFSGESRVVSAILGHSKGGNVVLLYASKYQDIRIVVNVSGRYDLKRGIAERLGEDFMGIIKKDGHIDVKNKTGSYLFSFLDVYDFLSLCSSRLCMVHQGSICCL
ncbi:hypothetical protein Goarm_022128, partial [Gossypium armourianum]|nr:hypothetical protein [Gossypium armourianum]